MHPNLQAYMLEGKTSVESRTLHSKEPKKLILIPSGLVLLFLCFLGLSRLFEIEAIVCPDGSVFADTCEQDPLPEGAVVIFGTEKGCPEGWTEFDKAKGRFIVGVGRHSVHDRYSKEIVKLGLMDVGGERTHKLSVQEMPNHSHKYQSSTGKSSPKATDTTTG